MTVSRVQALRIAGALALCLVLLGACGRRGMVEPPTEHPAPDALSEMEGDDKDPGRP